MKGIGFAVVAAVLSVTALAEIQIINGKKYECRDGMCMPVEDEPADGVKLPAVGGLELPPEPADLKNVIHLLQSVDVHVINIDIIQLLIVCTTRTNSDLVSELLLEFLLYLVDDSCRICSLVDELY